MPATVTASGVSNVVLGAFFGSSLQAAFNQINPGNPQNLDILQIVIPGGNTYGNAPVIALNVDYTGAVHNPAVNPTNGTRLGVFEAIDAASGSTTAQLFASVWKWNATQGAQADILQIVNIGGNISYYLNYLGVATGS